MVSSRCRTAASNRRRRPPIRMFWPWIISRDELTKPKVEAKARNFIHLGYQRLAGLRSARRRLRLFGRRPRRSHPRRTARWGSRTWRRFTTSIPAVISGRAGCCSNVNRTDSKAEISDLRPQVRRRQPVGLHGVHRLGLRHALRGGSVVGNYLIARKPADIDVDLALVCNALRPRPDRGLALSRAALKIARRPPMRTLRLLVQDEGGRTPFYGVGRGGQIETTALTRLPCWTTRPTPPTLGRDLPAGRSTGRHLEIDAGDDPESPKALLKAPASPSAALAAGGWSSRSTTRSWRLRRSPATSPRCWRKRSGALSWLPASVSSSALPKRPRPGPDIRRPCIIINPARSRRVAFDLTLILEDAVRVASDRPGEARLALPLRGARRGHAGTAVPACCARHRAGSMRRRGGRPLWR